MKAIRLKTEFLFEPVGIDIDRPRLFWNCQGGARQTAYEIAATAEDGRTLWESGRVESPSMRAHWGGKPVPPRTRVTWSVRLWDENNVPGEWSSATFETGLPKREPWRARWIAGDYDVDKRRRYPVDCFCKRFPVSGAGRARLYITACGLYEARLNGSRVGDFVLAPGHTDYRKRMQYQTYDVTALLKEGENRLEVQLADGWYRGSCGAWGLLNQYGTQTKLLAQLEYADESGNIHTICSDGSWAWSNDGPIRFADNKDGEVVDGRMLPSYSGKVRETSCPVVPSASNNVPVTEHERFRPQVVHTPGGKTVLDFGQNIAGYVEFSLKAKAGQRVKLQFGEMLDKDGEFTQRNIQCVNKKRTTPLQQVEYICREGRNDYKTAFAIFGFRYVLAEGDFPMEQAEFTAIAVYSDMERTGWFESSDPLLNRLFDCTLWSARNNHADLPTDCPTRERAGWTGDMGVFIETGLTLMDCYPVVEKWLAECRLNQYPDGRMANIAPPTSRPGYMTPMLCMSAGWGDAAILVPYALYKRTGDRKILADNYEMMQKWYGFLLGRAQQTTEEQQTGAYAKYTVLNGLDYGEWCEPGITPMQAMMNPRKSVGTAYLAYSGRLLAEIAQALGKAEDAVQYRDTAEKAVKAYRAAFTDNGKITSDRQCEYVRAIAFALLGEEESQAAADILNRMVVENGYHLNTGFLSTPFLCEVLAKYGYADTAYKLLLQDTAPSWLYEVKQGATTVWETWTGIDANGYPSESLNHYSYGAICGWLFGGVCGIHLVGETLTIAPTPNPALGWAKAVYDSPVGRIESGWQYAGDAVTYTITVPCNLTAEVTLPDGRSLTLQPGTHTL